MRPFILVAILMAATPAAAAEPSCLEVVDRLSRQFGFETSPPQPGEQTAGLSQTLESTGGVLQPPDVGAPVAVQPPEPADRMPTAPPLTGEAGQAGRLAQLESLLTAARAAGERGDTEQCVARLAEAEQLAAAE